MLIFHAISILYATPRKDIQSSGPISAVIIQSSELKSIIVAYIQQSDTRFLLITHTTSTVYATPIVKIHLSAINLVVAMIITSSSYTFLINLPPAITLTSSGPGKELLNSAKIYINEEKYITQNDYFIFELVNLWKNIFNSLSKNFRVGSTDE